MWAGSANAKALVSIPAVLTYAAFFCEQKKEVSGEYESWSRERRPEFRRAAEFRLDLEEAIVLGDALTAAG